MNLHDAVRAAFAQDKAKEDSKKAAPAPAAAAPAAPPAPKADAPNAVTPATTGGDPATAGSTRGGTTWTTR